MVVDTSIFVAILRNEADGDELLELLQERPGTHCSTAAVVETLLVMNGRSQIDISPRLRRLLDDLQVVPEIVSTEQAWLAGEAFLRFGKGRHRAALNYGDCFAYALARHLDLPLLFKGDDFGHTDIRPAR